VSGLARWQRRKQAAAAADGGDEMTSLTEPAGARAEPARPAEAADRRSSYRQILSSTAWIGGSQVINIAIGIVRTKVMAVLLGPAGFGLMGVLTAIADFARSAAEMGINNSGVRQIADAAASGDAQRIARTATVLRGTSFLLGLTGALVLWLLAEPISRLTFSDASHVTAVALLSLVVFLRLVGDARAALLQGLRRIADVAKINVMSALVGTAASIPLVYWLREDGVALALVAMAATGAAAAWWFSRRVVLERPQPAMTLAAGSQEASSLLQLGVAFMASALLMMGAAYVVRLMLVHQHGLEAAGLYQAAWTLGGIYLTVVLQAMGTDFYPRLVGVVNDREACNRLVNEQAHASLLLAGVGVLGTVALSPVAVTLFYSAEFADTAPALRWICLGMALRVISWPMGYIIVARGDRRTFFLTELAWTAVNVALSWLFIRWYGPVGAGIAFFASYIFHVAMIYPIVRRSGFRWSRSNLRAIAWYAAAAGGVFLLFHVVPQTWAIVIGCTAAAVAALGAFRTLRGLLRAPQAHGAAQ
jgi:PST family polysaccharide transporter